MALFLDPPSKFEETKVEKNKSIQKISGRRLLAATFHQMTNWKQILITPLSFWVGFELGFFVSDFTVVSMMICIYFEDLNLEFFLVGFCDLSLWCPHSWKSPTCFWNIQCNIFHWNGTYREEVWDDANTHHCSCN